MVLDMGYFLNVSKAADQEKTINGMPDNFFNVQGKIDIILLDLSFDVPINPVTCTRTD